MRRRAAFKLHCIDAIAIATFPVCYFRKYKTSSLQPTKVLSLDYTGRFPSPNPLKCLNSLLPEGWVKKALQLFVVYNYISISPCTCHINCIMLLSLVYNITGDVVPATISSYCCAIPFTLDGNLYHSCTDNGTGLGCFYGDREWKLCKQPAGEFSKRSTSTQSLKWLQ